MEKTMTFERLLDGGAPWVAEGGLETAMIYHEGLDLPLFSAVVLLETDDGRAALSRWYARFLDLARARATGAVLDTPTWRAGSAWAKALGRDDAAVDAWNAEAVRFVRAAGQGQGVPVLVQGVCGPAGDGYAPDALLTADEAEASHGRQVRALAAEGADLIGAVTMTHTGEAIGIARAAARAGLPSVVSFTVETDGRLPTGQTLGEAIAETDAATDAVGRPAFYMVNCAHPDHFSGALATGDWRARIGGVRANASRLSHAELDAAETLDDGDPEEFGRLYGALAGRLPNLRIFGGCCGSDHRHVDCAARHLIPAAA